MKETPATTVVTEAGAAVWVWVGMGIGEMKVNVLGREKLPECSSNNSNIDSSKEEEAWVGAWEWVRVTMTMATA
jgi:hypothetical protein